MPAGYIDIAYDDVVKIYYQCLGDNRLLDVDFAEHLAPLIKEIELAEGESE